MSDFGTEPYKLYRPYDPDTSAAAAHAVDTTRLEELVYRTIVHFGQNGCTQDQVLAQFAGVYPYSSITARFRALLDKYLVVDTGLRRPGRSGRAQRVLIATPQQLGLIPQ